MNKKILYALWGGLFILCAGLGFIPEPSGAAGWALTGISVAFFVPPAMLLYQAGRESDRRTQSLVCWLSALSLGLTLVLLVLNFLSVLVNTGKEHHVISLKALIARHNIGCNSTICVTDMKFV